jgi:soluble lytic murein transglycosylase
MRVAILKFKFLTAAICLVSLVAVTPGHAKNSEEYRAVFKDARQALVRGDRETSRQLIPQLEGYVLYPYAQYQYLQAELSSPTRKTNSVKLDAEVQQWLATNRELPIARALHREWLKKLARENNWKAYRMAYEMRPFDDANYRCNYVRSLIELKMRKTVKQRGIDLWLHGKSRPKACDSVFAWMEKRKLITKDLIWERIELAYENDQPNLARFLTKKLSKSEKERADLWYASYMKPANNIASLLKQKPVAPKAVVLSIARRMARVDVDLALEQWGNIALQTKLPPEDLAILNSYLAERAARDRHDSALGLLAALTDKVADDRSREWQMRLNMEKRNWAAMLGVYNAMPKQEKNQSYWRYWVGRSLEYLGHPGRAATTYASLAESSDYYGFLSADRIGQAYRFDKEALVADNETLTTLLRLPQVKRARQLFLLKLNWMARAEWRGATKGLSRYQIIQAAILADQWGWHSQALRSYGKAGLDESLALYYPPAYQKLILPNAEKRNIPEDWVWGLMRSESLFMPDVRSGAGAIGLMQIMPATGKEITAKLGKKWHGSSVLSNPETNIDLGTEYLRMMLDRFDNNYPAATAAYNAGPHRVTRWLPKEVGTPTDLWIDTIPFTETRRYVRRVMAHTIAFNNSRGDQRGRINHYLAPLPLHADSKVASVNLQ